MDAVIDKSNMIRSYLHWKKMQHKIEFSPYSSIFKGHFLVEIKCSECAKETFSFEEFGELSLDVYNLENNILKRKYYRKIFMKKRSKQPMEFRSETSKFSTGLSNFRSNIDQTPSKRVIAARKPEKTHLEAPKKEPQRLSANSFEMGGEDGNSPSLSNTRDLKIKMPDFSEKTPAEEKVKDIYIKKPREYPKTFLDDLITDFFEEDYVKDYQCSFCKKRALIRKTYKVLKEPEILILFFKRFIYYPKIMKIKRPIVFRDYEFDMEAYLYRPEQFHNSISKIYESNTNVVSEVKPPDISYNNSISFNRSMGQKRSQYEMVAYIEHSGSIDKGHYVCFNKNEEFLDKRRKKKNQEEEELDVQNDIFQTWFLQNDQKTYLVKNHDSKMTMYNTDVYSIFYRRKINAF